MAAVDLNTIRSSIEERLQTELKSGRASRSGIPVIFNNLAYVPESNTTWCQCLISFGSSSYETLGGATGSTNSLAGIVTVNIFTAKAKGAGENLGIAKRIRDLYNRIILSGVRFDPPIGPQVLDVSRPEGYFQTQIRVSFDVYEDL